MDTDAVGTITPPDSPPMPPYGPRMTRWLPALHRWMGVANRILAAPALRWGLGPCSSPRSAARSCSCARGAGGTDPWFGTLPLVRIRPSGVLPGPWDPGGRGWIGLAVLEATLVWLLVVVARRR